METETPTPETGTVHASIYKYVQHDMQLLAEDGKWRLESDLPIVDGMVTIQVSLKNNTVQPYIFGTATGKFTQNADRTWTATVPASDGDAIVIGQANSANTVEMTQGRDVTILGAASGKLAIPFTSDVDYVSFRVKIPAGSVPQVTMDQTGAKATVKKVNDTTWDVIVEPVAGTNSTGIINCTQNIPNVTVETKDSRVEITNATGTAPAGTYELKLNLTTGYEPVVTGANVSKMDAGEAKDGKVAWTVTLDGITTDVTLNVAVVEAQSIEIIRAVNVGSSPVVVTPSTDDMTVETAYAGMQGRAKLIRESGGTYKTEFVACVRGGDRLISESGQGGANVRPDGTAPTVTITPDGYVRRQDNASNPTGYWGRWKIEVTGLTEWNIAEGLQIVRAGNKDGQIKSINKEDPSIILEDILAFSYFGEVNDSGTKGHCVTFKIKTDGSTIPDVKIDSTVEEKYIKKTDVANEWEITLRIKGETWADSVKTGRIEVIPLLMPQIKLVDNGNNIRISGKDVVNANVETIGGTDYFTATFNYTKPAGTAVSKVKNGLTVSGVNLGGATVSTDATVATSEKTSVVISDGTTSGTITVGVEFHRDPVKSASNNDGVGSNKINVDGNKRVDTLLKDGTHTPILITARVDSYAGYDVTLLPAENDEFKVLGPDGYHTVSDAKGNAYFTIWMDNNKWEIMEDPGNYTVSSRQGDREATQVTITVENVTGPRDVRLKFYSVSGADVTYTATNQNIRNANKNSNNGNSVLFSPNDEEFPGTSIAGKNTYTNVAKNGRMSWRILTDCNVVPEIKATCAGADVSDLFNVEFLGVANSRSTDGTADRGVKAEWKVSVTELQDQTNIEFDVSDSIILPSGDPGSGADSVFGKQWYTLRGLDKNVYTNLAWIDVPVSMGLSANANQDVWYDGLRAGDKVNGAYAVVLERGAEPSKTFGATDGDIFQFIVLVKNGFRINDCFMVNDQSFELGDPYVAYEYNNIEGTFIKDGYHAVVISVKAETPIAQLKDNHCMILTAEMDK